jgi:hypothetical protein
MTMGSVGVVDVFREGPSGDSDGVSLENVRKR